MMLSTYLPTFIISMAASITTLAVVVSLLRRQRRRLESIITDFSAQNLIMARKLTEIMVGQQKKQDKHEEALEKVAGYAMRMRKEINILAERTLEDDDYAAPAPDAGKRVH